MSTSRDSSGLWNMSVGEREASLRALEVAIKKHGGNPRAIFDRFRLYPSAAERAAVELIDSYNSAKVVKPKTSSKAKKANDGTFVIPLDDDRAVQFLVDRKGYTEVDARSKVKAWREAATKMDYRGPICWLVKAGFTIKGDAPKAGPCYDNLSYMQSWELQNDEPTKDSLVFWIPKLAADSTGKSHQQMMSQRALLRDAHNLPANHCRSFGSISLLFALILTYYKLNDDWVPTNCLYAASDTLHVYGDRLLADIFSQSGLRCYRWCGDANATIGFFLLGVELLDA